MQHFDVGLNPAAIRSAARAANNASVPLSPTAVPRSPRAEWDAGSTNVSSLHSTCGTKRIRLWNATARSQERLSSGRAALLATTWRDHATMLRTLRWTRGITPRPEPQPAEVRNEGIGSLEPESPRSARKSSDDSQRRIHTCSTSSSASRFIGYRRSVQTETSRFCRWFGGIT